ncbi:hypothetical protein [uncultured Arcanobacterium sp.]|uniref:hypothetical protein n=1 Tax=uncultured Arcanobacterium sp. TaxID=487520 RepID=UPI002631FAD5|nr:hypothetical protein [uncultured Arcanobacterium sp.]
MLKSNSVLHVGDMAFTSTHLVAAANARGLNWKKLQITEVSCFSDTPLAILEKLGRGIGWEVKLLGNKILRPQIHLHSAITLPYMSWALGKNYALHLHGTDIRTRLYQDAYRETVLQAVEKATAVFYSTPDLAEHIFPLRSDARLVPVPISLYSHKDPRPRGLEKIGNYIFFTSRWESVKGGESQIETAHILRTKLPKNITLVGLDWGENAKAAAQSGVRLLPRLSNREFRAALRNAQLCVGQSSGIMGASELESLAEGTPLVVPLQKSWYTGADSSLRDIPVIGGTEVECKDSEKLAALAIANLEAGIPAHTAQWLQTNHSPQTALQRVLAGYAAANEREAAR